MGGAPTRRHRCLDHRSLEPGRNIARVVHKSGSEGLKRRFEGPSVFSLGAHWFLTHNRLDYNWENLATTTNNPMTDEPIREPEQIRQSCSRKLHEVRVGEDEFALREWTTRNS